MLRRARCPAAAARRVALPGRQARHASSSAEGAPGLPLRAWARAGASLQLCAGVVLGGTVLYQAGQQAALERKLHLVGESYIGVSIHIQCRRSGGRPALSAKVARGNVAGAGLSAHPRVVGFVPLEGLAHPSLELLERDLVRLYRVVRKELVNLL